MMKYHLYLSFIALLLVTINSVASTVTPKVSVSNYINIYNNPDQQPCVHEGVKVGRLRPGEQAEHLGSIPNWHIVRFNGVEGCVSKRYARLVTTPAATATNTPFEIHFLDVGTGDAAIIDIQDREIIIDGGNYVNDLHNYVRDNDIVDGPIELAIVTHGDSDHWKGFVRLLGFDGRGSDPRTLLEFWEPGYDRDCNPLASYNTFIQNMQGMVEAAHFLRPLTTTHPSAVSSGTPQSFTHPALPGVTFTLLYSDPAPTGPSCAYTTNNASIVLKIEINGVTMLFTGDANGKNRNATGTASPLYVEQSLLALEAQHPGTLNADLLKVPHHGSETANTQSFIDAIDPRFAIISASTVHHLPRSTVVDRYENGQRVVLRTDANRERNRDHIYCQSTAVGSLNCNYRDVLQ